MTDILEIADVLLQHGQIPSNLHALVTTMMSEIVRLRGGIEMGHGKIVCLLGDAINDALYKTPYDGKLNVPCLCKEQREAAARAAMRQFGFLLSDKAGCDHL